MIGGVVGNATHQEAPWKGTTDLGATLIEGHHQEAWGTYHREKGYQPVTAYQPEEDLSVADVDLGGNATDCR